MSKTTAQLTDPCPHCGGDAFEHCLATPSCTGPQPSGPPRGWHPFGTHAGVPGLMEFSEALDDAGMPMWERLALRAGASE
mgnify:CR=1 FL=1